MAAQDTVLSASIDLPLSPAAAFDTMVDELTLALPRLGLLFEPGPHGRITEDGSAIGHVTTWQPGTRIRLEWHPASWEPEKTTEIELRFEAAEAETRVTLIHRGLGPLLGDAGDAAGWFAGQVVAPMTRAVSPLGLGDWITDRRARRPSGPQARGVYRDPIYHRPNFRAILETLALEPRDYLVEVGCGGGAFLADALRSGCRAAAIDHSADMVRLAREVNGDAIAAGRVTIEQASAEHLPFADGTFTCAVMTGVFGFLAAPIAALAELHRVLARGGRLVVMGSDPAWRGTPAAPEPMASRLRFYDERELEALGRQAGFGDVRITKIPLEQYARDAGVPEEHVPLFSGPGAPFLIARRD